MYCSNCGKELPAGATSCPACGYAVGSPRSTGARVGDTLDDAIGDLRRAADELAQSAANLSKRVVSHAGAAAKDPSGSARKAAKKVADELHRISSDIEQTLRDL
jgi:hypothetical protein